MHGTTTHTFEKPEGVTHGRLEIRSGTSDLSVRGALDDGNLARATIGHAGPMITREGDATIALRHPFWSAWWAGRAARKSMIELARDVEFQIDVRGGASGLDVDMRGGMLSGIEIHGGVSGMVLALPRATRDVPIVIHGGAVRLYVHHPDETPVRLCVRGGLTDFSSDGFSAGAIGGPFTYRTSGDDGHGPGYSLTIHGGACAVVLQRSLPALLAA